MRTRSRLVAGVAGALLVAACAVPEADRPAPGRVSALPPIVHPADNPTSPAKVALGAQLFVDKRLSGSGNTACQSCHYRHLGWTDGLQFSRRDDGVLNTRNTPTLYNVGHQTLWYWDGRATTLEGQITAAWRFQTGADPAKIAALLNTIPGYATQFQAVFGAPASPEAVAKALAAYLRTKNSENSAWDRYESGDTMAVSAAAVDGFRLFMGKGRCAACHTPPFFGNSTFHNIGLEAGKAKPDPGRFNVTKNEADTGAFKTPTLRSVELGAPYFHDGSRATLEEAVRFMAAGGGDDPKKSPALVPTGLTEPEIAKIVEFLKTLTSTEPWTAPALP
ncbi:MAG: cytochrome-c peroxidase [Caldimonas sp.]